MDGTGKMANSIEASCDQLDSSAENKSPSTYGSDCLRGIMNVRTSIAILTFSWHQFDDFSGGKHLDFCSFVVTNVAYVHCILQTLTVGSIIAEVSAIWNRLSTLDLDQQVKCENVVNHVPILIEYRIPLSHPCQPGQRGVAST